MLVYCSPKESSSLIAKELVRYTGVHTTSEAAMKFATAVHCLTFLEELKRKNSKRAFCMCMCHISAYCFQKQQTSAISILNQNFFFLILINSCLFTGKQLVKLIAEEKAVSNSQSIT